MRFFLSLMVLAILTNCQNVQDEKNVMVDRNLIGPYPMPSVPVDLVDANEKINYLLNQYWVNFDFNRNYNSVHKAYLEQALVDYIHLFTMATEQQVGKSLEELLLKVKVNKTNLSLVIAILEEYLYNPNSPYQNEMHYASFIQALIKHTAMSSIARENYKTLLPILNLNKPGTYANNFTFYLSNAKYSKLYDLTKDYILLIFYEPGCTNCAEAIQLMKQHVDLNQWIERGELEILAVYPDGNQEIWESYQANIPSNWLNAVDLKQEVLKKGLYQIRATPSIYLLDQSKKVILKDVPLYTAADFLKQNIP
ncbi:DUF5106 domain-containing protein [Sphingobacterium sp. HJSM2_6]|uniref:DUF5106 domain-containing protein n=1 Tax=Sphingobacterium sp. HJSM2_6 TaxID=3366264 RepID=UPI003BE099A2